MSGPSEKAIAAAATTLRRGHPHDGSELDMAVDEDAQMMLDAAHDPALGLDRSVCLRDVVEALSGHPADHTFDAREIILLRFGGAS